MDLVCEIYVDLRHSFILSYFSKDKV